MTNYSAQQAVLSAAQQDVESAPQQAVESAAPQQQEVESVAAACSAAFLEALFPQDAAATIIATTAKDINTFFMALNT